MGYPVGTSQFSVPDILLPAWLAFQGSLEKGKAAKTRSELGKPGLQPIPEKTWQINAAEDPVQGCRFESGKRRECSLENLIPTRRIFRPAFLRAGDQGGVSGKKLSQFPRPQHHEPRIHLQHSCGSQLSFFFPTSLAKSAALRASQRDPPRVSPRWRWGRKVSPVWKPILAQEGKNISPNQVGCETHLLFSTRRVHIPANKL